MIDTDGLELLARRVDGYVEGGKLRIVHYTFTEHDDPGPQELRRRAPAGTSIVGPYSMTTRDGDEFWSLYVAHERVST